MGILCQTWVYCPELVQGGQVRRSHAFPVTVLLGSVGSLHTATEQSDNREPYLAKGFSDVSNMPVFPCLPHRGRLESKSGLIGLQLTTPISQKDFNLNE